MNIAKGFFRFWWDFVIGDDWKIAAAVASILVIGALVASSVATGASWLAPIVGVAVLLAFIVSLVVDVRLSAKNS